MKQFLTTLILLFSLTSANVASANTADAGNTGSPAVSESGVSESEVSESEVSESEANDAVTATPVIVDPGVVDPVIVDPVVVDTENAAAQRSNTQTASSWLLATVASIAKNAIANSESDKGLHASVLEQGSAALNILESGNLDLTKLLETGKNIDIAQAVDTAINATESLFDWGDGFVAGGLVDGGDATAIADPFENYNRMMFRFNQQLDEVALKPLAKHYRDYTPELVRIGVRNFFSNIGDVGVLTNSALQGKFDQALSDSTRVAVNTIAGVGGVIDVASMMNIKKNNEDFGQTFGVWGIPEGPYIVLPLLGPRTLRSAVGTIADTALQVETLGALGEAAAGTDLVSEMMALNLIDKRSQLLGQSDLLEELAIDPYIFSRQAYLAYRRCQVDDCDKINYQPAAPEAPAQNNLDELDELDELDGL